MAEMGRRVTEVTGEPKETFWLEQRIGPAVQGDNAHSILVAAVLGFGGFRDVLSHAARGNMWYA